MKPWKIIFAGLLLFHLILLATTQFIAWPEMLFWPYLVLKGWLPYRDIAIAHSPLLIYFLTFFYQLFGVSVWGQKLASWLLVFVLDIVLFGVSKKLFGVKKALLILLLYIPLQVYYDGNGIWFDHALAIFPILIYYFSTKKKYFLVGLLWGVALLVKQTALWFLLPIILAKPTFSFVKGALLVLIPFFMGLFLFGLLDDFLRWGIGFGIGTLPRLSGQINLPEPHQIISSLFPFLIVIPAPSLLPWLVAGAMGTLPRWELFHFQPALPFLAILFAFAVESKKITSYGVIILSFILVGRGLARDLGKPDRFFTPRDQAVIQNVRRQVAPGEAIFVTGYWDNIYPLTDTIPVIRPFIPQLPWYLSQRGIEEEIISDLTREAPKIIISPSFPEAGKIGDFVRENYKVVQTVGQIDILEFRKE